MEQTEREGELVGEGKGGWKEGRKAEGRGGGSQWGFKGDNAYVPLKTHSLSPLSRIVRQSVIIFLSLGLLGFGFGSDF